jgi:hypothetical protein
MGVLRPQPARGAGVSAGGARRRGRGRPRLADKGGKRKGCARPLCALATASWPARCGMPCSEQPTRVLLLRTDTYSNMFGSTTEFFFRHVAGIQQKKGTRGYTSLRLHPSVLLSPSLLEVCTNLSWVNASMVRPHGTIRASWACTPDSLRYNVTLPVSTNGEVYLPLPRKGEKTLVKEGGHVVWDGTKFISGTVGVDAAVVSADGLSVVLQIRSGRYTFSSSSAFS